MLSLAWPDLLCKEQSIETCQLIIKGAYLNV